MDVATLWGVIGGSAGIVGAVVGSAAFVLARRADRRSTERADVEWRIERPKAGVLALYNRGMDTAFTVRASIIVNDDERHEVRGDRVGWGEYLATTSAEAGLADRDMRERNREYEASQRDHSDPLRGLMVGPLDVPFQVEARITWRSASGKWTTETAQRSFSQEHESTD